MNIMASAFINKNYKLKGDNKMGLQKTNGYLTTEGKIRFLGAKSLKETTSTKKLNFAIETNKDNMINVEAFGWKKEDTDDILVQCADKSTKKVPYSDRAWLEEGLTLIGVSVKKDNDSEVEILVDVDAVGFIAENFKQGDSVFMNLKSDVDKYFNNLKWTISKIYPCKEELDFESDTFKEKNHGSQWVVFDSVGDGVVNTYVIGSKDSILPLVFAVSEDIPTEYFNQFSSGDALYLDFELSRTPIYGEVEKEVKTDKPSFTPIGKYADAENSSKTGYRAIKGYTENYICVGVKNAETGKYKMEEIKALLPESDDDMPF